MICFLQGYVLVQFLIPHSRKYINPHNPESMGNQTRIGLQCSLWDYHIRNHINDLWPCLTCDADRIGSHGSENCGREECVCDCLHDLLLQLCCNKSENCFFWSLQHGKKWKSKFLITGVPAKHYKGFFFFFKCNVFNLLNIVFLIIKSLSRLILSNIWISDHT